MQSEHVSDPAEPGLRSAKRGGSTLFQKGGPNIPTRNIMTTEIISVVFAGVGGQGILLASEVTARAAMAAGYDVKTNEVHGMAQRGGSVIAQVRFGTAVPGPLVPPGGARVLASLERIEALRYAEYLAPGGLAVVSTQAVIPVTVSSGQAVYPADAEARLRRVFPRLVLIDAVAEATKLGQARAANLVILGAVAGELPLPPEAWTEAIRACVKPQHVDVNLKAFAVGRALAASGRG